MKSKRLFLTVLMLIMALLLASCTPTDNGTPPPVDPSSGTPTPDIVVSYDDYITFEKEVASFSDANVTSKVTGTQNADGAIVTLQGTSKTDARITGVGTVKVNYTDGTSQLLKSEAARLSVLLIAGQSNAEGADGYAAKSVFSPKGEVYSTYAPAYLYQSGYCPESPYICGTTEPFDEYLDKHNGAKYVAKALTSIDSVAGNALSYRLNSLTEGKSGKGGIDSAIANEWNKQTGDKVWIINCAHSGSIISTWQKDYDDSHLDPETEAAKRANDRRNQYTEMNGVMSAVIETMEAEIDAGHYTLSSYGLFWVQGESDAGLTAQQYTDYFTSMYGDMKADWKIGGKSLEFASIIATRTFSRPAPYNTGNGAYTLADTALNGVRLAQFYMGLNNTGDLADIYIGSNVGDRFVGSDDYVQSYFEALYPDIDDFFDKFLYERPATMAELHHAGPHYTQAGYNELGRDAAQNTLSYIGRASKQPPAVQSFGELTVPDVYTLYKNGTYFGKTLAEFEALFKADYYTWQP